MQLGDLSSAVSDFSHMLSQSISLPFARRSRNQRPKRDRRVPRASGVSRTMAVQARGSLLLADGTVDDAALVEVIHRAGGRRCRSVVLPVAEHTLDGAGERYRRYLTRFGADPPQTILVNGTRRAQDPEVCAVLNQADLVLVGGGNPEFLIDIAKDSALLGALQAAFVRGATLALIGPVVEAFGEWCFCPDRNGAEGPLRKGLGLVPEAVVCTGSRQGKRLGQLLGAAMGVGAQVVVLDDRSSFLLQGTWQGLVLAGSVLAFGSVDVPGDGVLDERHLGRAQARVAPVGWRLDLAAHLVLPPGSAR